MFTVALVESSGGSPITFGLSMSSWNQAGECRRCANRRQVDFLVDKERVVGENDGIIHYVGVLEILSFPTERKLLTPNMDPLVRAGFLLSN